MPYLTKAKTKLNRVLAYLLAGNSLNRFEAQKLNDHCLNSTISTLKNCKGLEIITKPEAVPCLGGAKKVRVIRYWLAQTSDNIKRAKALLTPRAVKSKEVSKC